MRDSWLDHVLKYLFLGMAFAIPLFFNPWVFFKYEIQKIYFFGILLGIMLLVWLISFGSFKKLWISFLQWSENVRIFSLDFLLLIYLMVLGLATIFSISAPDSFWGLPDRRFGLVTIAGFVLLFWIYKNRVQSPVFFRQFCWVVLLAGFLASVYGILQKFGIDFTDLKFSLKNQPDTLLSFSVFGHPNYFGAYLAMILPFAFYLFLKCKNLWHKYLVVIAILFQVVALYFTLNRGSWLGFSVAIVFLSIFAVKGKKKWFLGGIILFAVAGALFLGGAQKDFSWKSGSMYIRAQEYKFAWQKIQERPLLGYGPETYQYLSAQREMPYEERVWDDRLSDRAHNIFLDVLLNAGIVGLVIWLLIFINVFYVFVRAFKQSVHREQKLILVIIATSIVAYLVQVQFHFDTVVTSMLLFMNFAFLPASPSASD